MGGGILARESVANVNPPTRRQVRRRVKRNIKARRKVRRKGFKASRKVTGF